MDSAEEYTQRPSSRPSAVAVVVWYVTNALVIAIVGVTIFLAWPTLRARFNGDPSTLPLAITATPNAAQISVQHAQAVGAPAALPLRNPGGSYNNPAAADAAYAAAVATTTPITPTAAATATPVCQLITWQDGSQSCDDGRAIDQEHGQPGYCAPVRWDNGTISCNDGKPSGKVVWADPEVQTEPTNTPWPAAPSSDVVWSAIDGPSNNTCVTVGAQTACSDPGVKLDADDAAFVARLIQDGKIKPGQGTPKG